MSDFACTASSRNKQLCKFLLQRGPPRLPRVLGEPITRFKCEDAGFFPLVMKFLNKRWKYFSKLPVVCIHSIRHQNFQYLAMKAPHRLQGLRLRSAIFSVARGIAGQSIISTADAGFQREECFEKVAAILQGNDTSIELDPTFFIDSNPANPILTLDGCEQLCGSGTGWYKDSGSRLVTWLLPIILLISNMQFQPIGIQRFLLVPHLLGDPIDSTWSLLSKAHHWSYCFFTAQTLAKEDFVIKSLAVILAAAHEVSLTLEPVILKHNARSNRSLIVETALTLADNRRNEFRRTLFALALYIFQVLAAFVPAVGAAASPSGGRIATAMLLSWLVPVVLLSNAVGDLGSLRNAQQMLNVFVERLEKPPGSKVQQPKEVLTAWTGSIYGFQPKKRLFDTTGCKLCIISVLPVAVASAAAFAILETGPTYFSCRHILVISLFVAWVLSTICTSWISWGTFGTAKSRWHWILIKDTIVASVAVGLIIASSCGLWKTCYCWSGAMIHGASRAQCPLNPTQVFDRNNNVLYPAIVATALCAQALVFAAMVWCTWPGFRTMWWSTEEINMADRVSHRD